MSVRSTSTRNSRRPPPGSCFKKAKPCQSAEDVTNLQRETLVSVVNEAKEAEEKRLRALALAPSRARASELQERHERERTREKERIEMLVSELNSIKSLTNEGSLDTASRTRSTLLPVKTMDVNRFDQEHMRSVNEKWIGRLDTLERRSQNSGKYKCSEYDERRKLILLEEKRNVIKDMIKVQSQAIQAVRNPQSARVSNHSYPVQRHSSRPRSECGRSEASCATFASSSKSVVPVPKNHHQFEAKVNRMVPKLDIGTTVLRSKV